MICCCCHDSASAPWKPLSYRSTTLTGAPVVSSFGQAKIIANATFRYLKMSGRRWWIISETDAHNWLQRPIGFLFHFRDGSRNPCLQCLRQTFAVERLREWYRLGVDVQALIPNLSVYLGHLRPQETYWYLIATPELPTAAAEKFQRYAEKEGSAM
jgi:hypothetical protein